MKRYILSLFCVLLLFLSCQAQAEPLAAYQISTMYALG